MPHALNRVFNRFLVYYIALAEADLKPEPVEHDGLQHLKLDVAHEPYLKLRVELVPYDVELRILTLEDPELFHGGVGIHSVGQLDLISEHGLKNGQSRVLLNAETVARICKRHARHCTDRACLRFACGGKLFARIDAYLVYLFTVFILFAFEDLLYLKRAARDFHKGEPVFLVVLGNFKYLRGKLRAVIGHFGVPVKAVEELLNALQPQRRAEHTRKDLSLPYRGDNIGFFKAVVFVVIIEKPVVAYGDVLKELALIACAEIDAVVA